MMDMYKQCPFKFKLVMDGKVIKGTNIYLEFGNYIHETLELFVKDEQFGQPFDDINKLIHTYNSLEDKYIIRFPSIREKISEGKSLLTNYYNKYMLNQISYAIKIEQKILLDLGFVKVSGKIDRIDKVPSGIKVIDYKTGKEKVCIVKDDIQLETYALSVLMQDETLDSVIASWHYLKTKEVQHMFLRSDIEIIKNNIWKIYNDIVTDKNFSPNVSWLCDYCEIEGACFKANNIKDNAIFIGRKKTNGRNNISNDHIFIKTNLVVKGK